MIVYSTSIENPDQEPTTVCLSRLAWSPSALNLLVPGDITTLVYWVVVFFKQGSRYSRDLRRPSYSKNSWKITKELKGTQVLGRQSYSKNPEDSKKIQKSQKNPRYSKIIQNILKESKRFQKIPKLSKRFKRLKRTHMQRIFHTQRACYSSKS